MPAIVAIALRYVIMAAVQLGLWSLIEKYGLPMLNSAIEGIMQAFGVSKDVAQDIMANSMLKAFEDVGIFAITLKTKMPIKVAEALGFTTKGWTLRTLPAAIQKLLPAVPTAVKTVVNATAADAEAVATTVAKSKGLSFDMVKKVTTFVATLIGLPVGVFYAFAQYMDYAAWQNPYQKTMQGLLAKIGIPVDTVMPSAKTISSDTWKRIYATIEELQPTTINMPDDSGTIPYSRENLATAVDSIAAQISASGGSASYKNVLGALLPMIHIQGAKSATAASASTPAAAVASVAAPAVKVFTGLLSSGTLGSQTPYTAREDDLITSAEELTSDAQQNAAGFIAAIAGKIQFELKIVNSVLAADGSRRVGATQQVPNGIYKDGRVKYKTVTNKFAVLALYYNTREGRRTKLADITLGPTDVAQFNPTPQQLSGVASNLGGSMTTSDVGQISQVVTSQPLAVTTVDTPAAAQAQVNYNTDVKIPRDTGYRFYSIPFPGQTMYEASAWLGNVPYGHTEISEAEYRAATGDTKDYTNSGYYIENGVPYIDKTVVPSPNKGSQAGVAASSAAAIATAKAAATNLSDFYAAMSLALPSVSDRGTIYQSLGLGAASLYTGTATQNTKLLAALQGK